MFLLTLVTFYIALIYESSALILLAITEAVFVVLGFVCAFYRTRRLRAALRIPISLADKQAPVSVGVELKNNTKLAVLRVKLLVECSRCEKRIWRRWISFSNVLSGTSGQFFSVSMDEPGCYEFTVKKLRVYDMTGLIHLDIRQKSFGRILVLPEIREIPVHLGEDTRNFFGDAETYDELRPGYDPAETFDVRQFRDGDRLQSIHWKLSVKLDDLVVRERSLPKGCPVVLFLDASGGKSDFFAWVSAISFSLMDAGCPHFAVWFSRRENDILRARVDDEESFYLFLTTYLEDGDMGTSAAALTERYREKYRGQQYLHALYLNGRPELFLDGERLQPLAFDKIELLL
jgi:uncharacterized protein (DUF58 family)